MSPKRSRRNAGTGTSYQYAYYTNHRLSQIQLGQSSPYSTTFTYDTEPNSNCTTANANGRMTSASNNGYTWHYSYDQMGRVSQQTLQTPFYDSTQYNGYGQNSFMNLVASYLYDSDGKPSKIVYPGSLAMTPTAGTSYQYAYDVAGRVTTMQVWNGSTWNNIASNAAFNAAGQLTDWQETASSATMHRAYDPLRGWMTDLTATGGSNTLLNYHYDYFASGQLQRVRDYTFSATPADTTYTYDNLDRLASAATANASPTWTMAFSYDDFGNRTSQTGTGSAASLTQTLTFDPATNRITSPSQYALYDANGNMGSAAAFDAFDRLIGNYYDAFGRRVAKPGPNNSNQIYFTDMSGRLLARYSFTCYDPNNNGLCYPVSAPTDTYQYFAGQRVGQLADRLGSTRNQTAGYDHYYPYGEKISGTSDDTFKFAQTYRDGDSGLDYAKRRYYSSSLGRFLTSDPSGKSGADFTAPQSLNRYAYSQGDPINFLDPAGTHRCDPSDSGCGSQGTTCDFVGDEDDGEWVCYEVIGGGSGPGPSTGDDEPVANCLSAFTSDQVNFVTAHYVDSVSLGTQAGLPSTWILGWSAQETGWGVKGAILRNPNNFFSWHGRGDARCPPGAIKVEGCFTSYYAAGRTALFSMNNYFHYQGLPVHSGVTAGLILLNQYQNGASASQAFQTLANSGYVSNPVYGVSVATDIGFAQRIEDCLSSLGLLPKLP